MRSKSLLLYDEEQLSKAPNIIRCLLFFLAVDTSLHYRMVVVVDFFKRCKR